MKKIIISFILTCCSLFSFAQPPTFVLPTIHGGNTGQIINVDVQVLNFNQVGAFQGTFEIQSPNFGQIISVQNHMTNASLSSAILSPSVMTFLTQGTLCNSPVSFSGNSIFTVSILLTGNEGTCSTIAINSLNTPLEIYNYVANINDCIEVQSSSINGQIQIAGGCNNTLNEPNNDCVSATLWPSVILNGTNSSTSSCLEPGDNDFYRFTTQNGQEYVVRVGLSAQDLHGPYVLRIALNDSGDCLTITTEARNGNCIDTVDTVLELFEANDCTSQLAFNDDSGNSTFSELTYCDTNCDCVRGELAAFNIFDCDADFALSGLAIDGCATLIPTFTWNFGDGQTATTSGIGGGLGIHHTYTQNGTYTASVSFVVINNETGQPCTQTYQVTITISGCNENPCHNFSAPTNLQVGGIIGTTLTWDPVPGAVQYIVSSQPFSGGEPGMICHCKNQISIVPITTTNNSLALPSNLVDKCFAWRVTAVCSDGTTATSSTYACYTGKSKEGRVAVSPNPSDGAFKINLNEIDEGTVEITDMYGLVVYKTSFKNQNEVDVYMKEQPFGIYIVKVYYGDTVFTEKIIKN